MSKARVSLVHGGDRRANVFNALELVRADVESRLADQVMLPTSSAATTSSPPATPTRCAASLTSCSPRPFLRAIASNWLKTLSDCLN